MFRSKTVFVAVIAVMLAFIAMPSVSGQSVKKGPSRDEAFDPIEFIKQFKIGMSYSEVQEALPKNVEQDILSYIVTEEVFMLSVDMPTRANWSASFKFDTLDTPMRRPERLIELSCGATLSSRSETFDSIVRRVTEAFGEPVRLDRTEEQIKQANWRVSGGSVLTLEYSIVPSGLEGKDVSVDFLIKRNKRRDAPPKATA